MLSVMQTVFPFFMRPTNYGEMLLKLAGFTFWECVIFLYLLRRDTRIEEFLDGSFLNFVPIEALPEELRWISMPIFLISLFIAFIFFYFQIHDQIQKPLKIRQRFDTDHIFARLAQGVGVQINDRMISNFLSDRNSIMRKVFYNFASSTKDSTVVDKHDIHQALWLWSMFWAFEEFVFISIIFLIPFISVGMWSTGVVLLLCCLAALLLMWQLWPRVSGAARAQVDQIVADKEAKKAVQKVLNAL